MAKFTHTFEYEIMNDIIKMSGSIKNESEIYFEIVHRFWPFNIRFFCVKKIA